MTFNGIKASNYGFEKYTSGCFLTTATVKYMGKPDDCYELTVLRDFRDKYMLTDSKRKEEVQKYYQLGPNVVAAINNSKNRDEILQDIYDNLVVNSIKLINQNKLYEAYQYYKKYTINLYQKLQAN